MQRTNPEIKFWDLLLYGRMEYIAFWSSNSWMNFCILAVRNFAFKDVTDSLTCTFSAQSSVSSTAFNSLILLGNMPFSLSSVPNFPLGWQCHLFLRHDGPHLQNTCSLWFWTTRSLHGAYAQSYLALEWFSQVYRETVKDNSSHCFKYGSRWNNWIARGLRICLSDSLLYWSAIAL